VNWRAGVLDVAAGAVPVELGEQPLLVLFFGTNFTAVDTVVTSAGTGLFRGFVAANGVQGASSTVPAGDNYRNDDYAILMVNTGGGGAVLYRATVTLGATGFVANFDTAAAGHKVAYAALCGVPHAHGIKTSGGAFALGFRPKSCLNHGAWAGPVITGSDRTQTWYGGASYPPSALDWRGAWACCFTFPTSSSAQYNLSLGNHGGSPGYVGEGGHFSGPFLATGWIYAPLSGTGEQTVTINCDGGNDGGVFAFFDAESRTGYNVPAAGAGDESTHVGLPFTPGLLIGYSMSDEPRNQGTGGRGAIGLSFATRTFQWAATIDGVNRGAFQSFDRGFCDVVHDSSVHAGRIKLTSDGFVATTVEDAATPQSWLWHAFEGAPVWLPQVHRFSRLRRATA
jgi:hypothetical protein